MQESKKKNWFRRHWIISSILGIILLIIIISIANSGNSGSGNSNPASANDVWSKTSGYTLDDCLTACGEYCIQAQTDVCQSSCEMIGKEGNTMDKTVNNIKNITAKLSC